MTKNKFFKVQISNELYNDFINKYLEKYLSKDMLLGFIMNLKINKKTVLSAVFFIVFFYFWCSKKQNSLTSSLMALEKKEHKEFLSPYSIWVWAKPSNTLIFSKKIMTP